MPDEKEKYGVIKKIFNYIISLLILLILYIFSLPQYSTIKYGSFPTPFDNRLLKYLKIRGRIISKASDKPISDMEIKLNAKNLKTITNKDGIFMFELFNVKEENLKIEIPGLIPIIDTKTYKINFNNCNNSDSIESHEATLEIYL